MNLPQILIVKISPLLSQTILIFELVDWLFSKNDVFICVLALSYTVYCKHTTLVLEKLTLIPDTFKWSRNSFYFQNIS